MHLETFKTSLEKEFSETLRLPFRLLEFSFLPYAFGSGTLAYGINGCCLLFEYDGREDVLLLKRSAEHEKYPNCAWQLVKECYPSDTFDIPKILKILKLKIDS